MKYYQRGKNYPSEILSGCPKLSAAILSASKKLSGEKISDSHISEHFTRWGLDLDRYVRYGDNKKNFFVQGPKNHEGVLGSLGKPHQSKELPFSSRFRSPTFFLTPPDIGYRSI